MSCKDAWWNRIDFENHVYVLVMNCFINQSNERFLYVHGGYQKVVLCKGGKRRRKYVLNGCVVFMMQESGKRKKPNILVTGTPGTGKTTMSTALAEATLLRHINVGELVKEKNLHDGWDDELDCYVLNEDLVCDELEDVMEEGGNIVDYHGCDFFPERWFDYVIVLQTDNTILYDRLSKRGYNESKLSNNVECEIFQVLLEEAKESYPEDKVVAMKSDNIEDISRNVATLTDWIRNWPIPS